MDSWLTVVYHKDHKNIFSCLSSGLDPVEKRLWSWTKSSWSRHLWIWRRSMIPGGFQNGTMVAKHSSTISVKKNRDGPGWFAIAIYQHERIILSWRSDSHQVIFYLIYILTFYLAFCLTFYLVCMLAFFLACVRVHACPAACGARDRAPVHACPDSAGTSDELLALDTS